MLDKHAIARSLREIAGLLALKEGENPWKARAYDTAKEEAERQAGEGVADEVRSTLNDTSIAPTEADACSDKTGETKPVQDHERQ